MKQLILAVTACLTLAFSPLSQGQTPGTFGGNSEFAKLLGKNGDFSGKAAMEISSAQTGDMTMLVDMAVLNGDVRSAMDMSQMKGGAFGPELLAQMKKMGMDKIVSIVRPAKNTMTIVYPSLKGYVESPMPKEAAGDKSKTEETILGKETVDKHPCVKKKIVITDAKGKKQEMILWAATDLKDFPVKIEMNDAGTKVLVRYESLKFTKPDAKDFQEPAGFKKYATVQELMASAFQGAQ